MSEINDFMNRQIVQAAGREPGDQAKPKQATGMNRILLNAFPKNRLINFEKKDEE